MSKFYGIISTTSTRTEEYEQKLKNGKTVKKTREITVPKEVTVQSSQPLLNILELLNKFQYI